MTFSMVRRAFKAALIFRAAIADALAGPSKIVSLVRLPDGTAKILQAICLPNGHSRNVAKSVLAGEYPVPDFVSDVTTVVDVGANVGAASVYFATLFPKARIFAFEPCRETFQVLAANARANPAIEPVHAGLLDRDGTARLFHSITVGGSNATNSLVQGIKTSESDYEDITLVDARRVLAEMAPRIDVLKADTEGSELPILTAIADRLAKIKLIYLEYHSEEDRIAIDALVRPSHMLFAARAKRPHSGILCYVARNLVPDEIERYAIRPVAG